MAQAGYTPIQLYYSSTTTNAPTAGNLASGELAINITDGKLFYKDNGGSVQVIAWKTTPTTAGGTGLTSWTAGDLPYYATGTTLSKLGIGTNGQILTSTGTAPQWSTLSGVAVTTFSAGTTGFTPSSATSGAITLAGTLATTNGGTGLTSFTANGVVYASSSSALTTGSALTFDGTNFAVGTTTINNANTDVVTVGKNSGTYDASIVVRQFGTGTAAGLQLIAAGDTGAAYNSITSTTSGGTQHWKLGGVAGSAGTLPFSVSGTEAMRLTSTGLGIGTSSPQNKFVVSNAGAAGFEVDPAAISGATYSLFINRSTSAWIDDIRRASTYQWRDSTGTERMRLDSSGNLGIGTSSPVEKVQSSKGIAATGANQSVGSLNGFVADYSGGASRLFASRNGVASSTLEFWTTDTGGAANKNATLDSSGNLGLGVTPSAWTRPAIQVGAAGTVAYFAATNVAAMTANMFYDGQNKYIGTGAATQYAQSAGAHVWYNAASGTAGNAISFTQAMTLDASGNLLVGTTSGLGTSNRASLVNNQSTRSVIAIQNTSTSGYSSVELYDSSGSQQGAMGWGNASVAVTGAQSATYLYSTGAITFLAGGTTERARITSGGNFSLGGSADRGTTVGSAALQLFNGTAPAGTLTNGVSLYSSSGDLRFMDAAGNAYPVGFRNIPQSGSAKTGSYTLATTDVGEFIQISTGGSIVIPNSTFAAGDVVSLFNNTTGSITITCSTTNAYIAGTDTNKASMTLATRGVATILFVTSTLCVVSGNVT